jgi:hypothetical protein
MAKALKTAGMVIAGAALIATGIGAAAGAGLLGASAAAVAGMGGTWTLFGVSVSTLSGIGTGLTAIGTLLTKRPGVSTGGSPVQQAYDPSSGVPYPFGRTAVAGRIVYGTVTGPPKEGNKYRLFYSVISGVRIDGIESFSTNDELVSFTSDSGEGASGTYKNRMWQVRRTGAPDSRGYLRFTATGTKDTPADHGGNPPEWTAQHTFGGMAVTLTACEYDQKVYASDVKPMYVIRAARVYDPRLDDTYPGGAGACRSDDENTFVFSENPWLHALTWAMGRYQNGQRVLGLGAAPAFLPLDQFVEGANIADANGWKIGGTAWSTDDKWAVLRSMAQAGGGDCFPLGGKIGCMVNAPRVSLATIEARDIVGPSSASGTRGRRDRINAAVARYRSEAHGWEIVSADPIVVAAHVAEDRDQQRTREIDYPYVQDLVQAGQLARYDIENSREFGPISLRLGPKWMGFRPGDALTLNLPELGLNGQLAVVTRRALDPATFSVTLELRSETTAKHAFALGQTATAPPIPTLTGNDVLLPGAPPAEDVTIEGGVVAGPGGSLPVIVYKVALSSQHASHVIVDYRQITPTVGEWRSREWPVSALAVDGDDNPVITLTLDGLAAGATYQSLIRFRTVRGVEDPSTATPLPDVTTGGVDAGTVNGQDVIAAIDDLVETFGDTASAAASAAAANAAKGVALAAEANAWAASDQAWQAYIETSTVQAEALDSATAAYGQANAAAGSATTAANKANEAAGYASSASASANTASVKAGEAATSASAASTSASSAAGSATAAGTSASAAQASAVTATAGAAATMPSTFDSGGQYFTSNESTPAANLVINANRTLVSVAGEGVVYQVAESSNIVSKGRVPVGTTQSHRVSVRQRLTVAGSGPNYIQLGWLLYNQADQYVGYYIPFTVTLTTATGWTPQSLTSTSEAIKASAVYFSGQSATVVTHIRPFVAGLPGSSGGTQQHSVVLYQNVTAEVAAAGSAAAAATSASSAAGSATAAGNSASAANTSATNASTSAGQAATSAGNASTSASQASTSASNAAGSASTASTQATVASAAATSATNTAKAQFPAGVTNRDQWTYEQDAVVTWGNYPAGRYYTASDGTPVWGSEAAVTETLIPTASFTPVPGRRYQVVCRIRRVQNVSNGRPSIIFLGMGYRPSTGFVAPSAGHDATAWPLGAWQTVVYDWVAVEAQWARPRVHVNWDSAGTSYSNAKYEVASLIVTDVTSETAAAGSATSAATSASAASTSATNAGVSATSASTSANTASTQAGNASSSATSAVTSAAAAGTSAAAAQQNATLAASVGPGVLNKNPVFSDYPTASGLPGSWSDWSNGVLGTRQSGEVGPYAFDVDAPTADDHGIQQGGIYSAPGWYVIEADAWLQSGTWSGACVLFWGANEGGKQVDFATDPDIGDFTGALGPGVRRFRKMVQVTVAEPKTLYCMTNYAAVSQKVAKRIRWYRVAVRPATEGEIKGRRADANAGSALAQIAAEAATRASETSALTSSVNTHTSQIGGLTSTVTAQAGTLADHTGKLAAYLKWTAAAGSDEAKVEVAAGGGNSIVRLVARTLSRATAVGGAVLDVLTIVGDVVRFARPVEIVVGGAKLCLGPGFGSSGNLVMWFGPSVAQAQMSKGNATFWLDNAGGAYFGGSIMSGRLSNSATGTDLSVPASLTLGPFGTNGQPITVNWSYVGSRQGWRTGNQSASGAYTVGLALYRTIAGQAETQVDTKTISGTFDYLYYDGEFNQTMFRESIAGAFTFTDTAGGVANRTYRVVVTSRVFSTVPGNSSQQDGVVQRYGLVTSEN